MYSEVLPFFSLPTSFPSPNASKMSGVSQRAVEISIDSLESMVVYLSPSGLIRNPLILFGCVFSKINTIFELAYPPHRNSEDV